MNKKETRPTSGNVGRARTETCGVAISCNYSNTNSMGRQGVAEWLDTGEENGKTLKQLREILDSDPRAIRQQIERERRGGCPILSGQHGYYLAGSETEATKFVLSMQHRARAIYQVANCVARATGLTRREPQIEGQMQIGGCGDG